VTDYARVRAPRTGSALIQVMALARFERFAEEVAAYSKVGGAAATDEATTRAQSLPSADS